MRLTRTVFVAALLAAALPAHAQTVEPFARAADGHPDFQGNWQSRWVTPLERMRGAKAVSVDAPTAEALVTAHWAGMGRRPGHTNPDSDFDYLGLAPVDGAYRTSLVTVPDTGRIPFTPEATAAIDKLFNGSEALDNPEERDTSERCIGGGGRAPMVSPPSNAYVQIVQTGAHMVVLSEGLNDVRILPTAPVAGAKVTSFQGISDAHWEGDTFVVKTVGFRADDAFRIAPPSGVIMLSPKSVVEERFTPVARDEFRYGFTVTDDALYTQPWSAETTYKRTDAKVFEYACHEGNYSMTNMLQGGRKLDSAPKKKG